MPSLPPSGTSAAAARGVRAALVNKVCGDEDMFALGSSVARVVQMASSDDEGTHDLAYYVLSDVALTQRILRLSNTVQYRTASGTTVTTISRAISLLGFDYVKTTALAMLLVDALSNSAHATSVRIELEAALCASLVGREMARHSFYQGAEEASIAALFKNLGPLLVASHEHQHPSQASQLILGSSYDALSEAVLAEWKISDVIVRALAPLPAGAQRPAANRGEWMRQVASFGLDVARLMGRSAAPGSDPEARALLARYGAALDLSATRLEELFAAVAGEMDSLLQSMNLQPKNARDLLPAWHKALLADAQSFIVLPLVVGKVQLGLFYADRAKPAPEGVPPDETALIKALKGQVLAALAPG